MEHTYEKISGNKAKLTFTVPADEFEAAVQQAYLKNRKSIRIPGFRPGKAPRALIEQMYGKGAFYEDAIEDLCQVAYPEAVEAENLQVVDRPTLNVEKMTPGEDVVFTCEVFVRPDVTLGDYKGLTVKQDATEVTDEQVKARVAQDQEKVARMVDVTDRAVENGDTVNLDYAGSVDGVAFEGGTAEKQTLVIGSKSFIEGFEDQMIGMSIGEEKDLNVTFPEQYHAENLAGKPAMFHVKVNGIQKKELPELDDDFAADVSKFDTYAEYEADIRKNLEETAAKNAEIKLENDLVEIACKNAQMDIPQPMIENQIDDMLQEMKMRMSYQGLRYEDYLKYTGMTEQGVRDMYKQEAESRVKSELVLDAIRTAEGIEPTAEAIEKQNEEYAKRMGQDVEAFKAGLTEQQKGYLKDSAAIQMVLDLLKSTAVIEK